MDKPMYCPMMFGNAFVVENFNEPVFCTPDCAWAVNVNGKYSCCFPVIARMMSKLDLNINFRPLKDDSE